MRLRPRQNNFFSEDKLALISELDWRKKYNGF